MIVVVLVARRVNAADGTSPHHEIVVASIT
jgi:hypothetical protein